MEKKDDSDVLGTPCRVRYGGPSRLHFCPFKSVTAGSSSSFQFTQSTTTLTFTIGWHAIVVRVSWPFITIAHRPWLKGAGSFLDIFCGGGELERSKAEKGVFAEKRAEKLATKGENRKERKQLIINNVGIDRLWITIVDIDRRHRSTIELHGISNSDGGEI